MSLHGIELHGRLRFRRGIALAVAAMLVSVLSVYSMAAVTYLLNSLRRDTASEADARVLYLAELARADALAWITGHSDGPWPHSRAVTAVVDDRNRGAGEYSYVITDLTLPEQNQRRLVHVHAYWPTQSDARAATELRVWLEQRNGTWQLVAWATGDCAIGG